MRLRAVAHYLPDTELVVADLPELAEYSEIETETCLNLGIGTVRGSSMSTVDLAVNAARQTLSKAEMSARDVDAMVVVESRAPESLLASETTRVQALLGATRAVTFSVGGLGCVSLTPAFHAARGLLADEDIENVLVVHGSRPPTPRRYRHPVTVSGDGGQAMLLGRSGPIRILDVLQHSNGDYWDLFTVDFRDRPTASWREDCADLPKYSFKLAVETRNHLRRLYKKLLDRNGLTSSDVDCHVGQNLSAGGHRFTEETLSVELAKVCYENLRNYGHLGPNDMLVNLTSAIESGELPEGGRAVMFGASPVAAWSLVLVQNGDAEADVHYL